MSYGSVTSREDESWMQEDLKILEMPKKIQT